MTTNKKNIILKDLRFCKELMNRIVEYTEKNYLSESTWQSNHTVIQADIIRLRRELNEIRHNLEV